MGLNGDLQFQDTPCQSNAKESALTTDYDQRGFLKKWFKIPTGSSRATCDNDACKCGNQKLYFSYRSESALPKMVDGLINAWSRYKNIDKGASRDVRRSAACSIRMHQKAFEISYNKFNQENKKKKRGTALAQKNKNSCQSKRDNTREERIKKLMSPPYNQSRNLAERNTPRYTHMGNPCDRAYKAATRALPGAYDIQGRLSSDAFASIERLK